ncbi:hypothetical protein ACFX1X_012268 [Malus domestica]
MRDFNDFIRETELKDLELLNAQFTWSNLREEPVCRRLDRFLCSTGCEDIFPEARQTALARVISDHCPVQLDTNKVKWGPCPFRFENMWLQDPEFRNKFKDWWQSEQVEGWEGYKFMIKLKAMKQKVQSWSKESFGEIEKVLKEVETNIEELDRREGLEGLDFEARSKREELQTLVGDLAFKEEVKWRQRSKVEWAKEGDGNTKFFHRVANGRRKRNYIERLESVGGGIIEDAKEIEEHIVNFFRSLFSSNDEACWGLEGINWAPISALQASWLERPFEEIEVQRAVFDCGKDKSPGPDGFSMQMFQHCWDILKKDIMKIMEEFFEKGIINAVTNETFICLIPKKSDSLKVTDYRPISLVTGLYKIIAKTLASRLKEVLDTTVSPNQGAFVKDRQILDAVLIANEVVEEVRQKKEKGLVLKIDFEKAYDHVEWRFMEEVLQRKGFGNRWRKWMQGCLSSANFSVLINGRPRGKFQASRGLRQGDPLSPFLFTLVVDVLSRLMEKAQETDLIKGLCIGQEKMEISHLQFADDTIFFLTEDEEVWNNLIQVLNLFCSVSGLKINKAKCFLAGINSESEKLNRLAVSWGCEVGRWPIKYLGLPLGGRPRAIKFWDPVVETMERRLQSWKKAFLSRGGKLTLIQSVLGSMPIYYMSLFKIPCGVRGRLEKLMKGFLWEGMEEGKKTHLAKWELVTKNKEEGGLGVGNLRNQNEALLAKWLWRLPRESQSLWHKVIRSKYGLQANGWDALPQRRVSSRSPWKDISSGSHQFLSCCTFEVGNGERVRFWEDGWLTGGPLKEQFPRLFLLSRKHNQNISSFVEVSSNPLSWNFDFRRNLNEMEIVEVATLLQKLEEVRLSPLKMDIRRWNLEASGLFSCKSYRSLLSNNGSVHYFPPYPQIWKSKVPLKVKILVWLVANGNLNTCDRIQRRNPLMCLSPHWCSLCKAKEESVNHIFLHCSYSIQLWWKLLQEVKASWVIPKGCFELLSTNFQALGKRKKSKVLWGCLVSAIFWHIWLERNKRIFEDYTGVGAEELWGRVKYWAALWASVTKEFDNVSLSQILWDLLAAVK